MRYGESFLTKHRWVTDDEERATESPWQWVSLGDLRDSIWGLSLLGVINGLLPFGRVLVVHHDDETEEITGWSIRRRWW